MVRNGERFWGEILDIIGDDCVIKIRNDLIMNEFKWGDKIILNKRYLYNCPLPDED